MSIKELRGNGEKFPVDVIETTETEKTSRLNAYDFALPWDEKGHFFSVEPERAAKRLRDLADKLDRHEVTLRRVQVVSEVFNDDWAMSALVMEFHEKTLDSKTWPMPTTRREAADIFLRYGKVGRSVEDLIWSRPHPLQLREAMAAAERAGVPADVVNEAARLILDVVTQAEMAQMRANGQLIETDLARGN